MKASKFWGPCACGCGRNITKGDNWVILEGYFFIEGHETRDMFPEITDHTITGNPDTIPQGKVSSLPMWATREAEQGELFPAGKGVPCKGIN